MLHRIITATLLLAVLVVGSMRYIEYREANHRSELLAKIDAADAVRAAISQYQKGPAATSRAPLDFSSVETLVRRLTAAQCLDQAAASFVMARSRRFVIRHEGKVFNLDARWVFDDAAL